MRRAISMATWLVAASLVLCICFAHAAQELTGQTASGAYYRIKVPTGWKPGDPLVLFQHGFTFDDPKLSTSLGSLEELQLSEGYAVAASSYSQRAWALFRALDDNAQLLDEFRRRVAAPGSVIPFGASLGGLVALRLAEDPRFAPTPGVLSLCPPAAGARVWDSAVDMRLAYDVICRDVSGAGLPLGSVPTAWAYPLDAFPQGQGVLGDETRLAATLSPVNVCTGIDLSPRFRSVDQQHRLDELKAFGHITDDKFFLIDVAYATFGLGDLVLSPDKLNGLNPFTTIGVTYVDATINAGIARIAADPLAQQYFRMASDFHGRVAPSTKVVSAQTSRDQLVIPANQSVLRATLPPDQLTSALVNEASATHCGFTAAEGVAAWEGLRAWIAGNRQPQVGDLQNLCQTLTSQGTEGPCRFDASIVPPSFDSQVAPRP